jgi:hypothetical protein
MFKTVALVEVIIETPHARRESRSKTTSIRILLVYGERQKNREKMGTRR